MELSLVNTLDLFVEMCQMNNCGTSVVHEATVASDNISSNYADVFTPI